MHLVYDKDLKILYEKCKFVLIIKSYVPEFLSFREVNHLLRLLSQLKITIPDPEVIFMD